MDKLFGFISLKSKHEFYLTFGIVLFFLGLVSFVGYLWVFDYQTDKLLEGIAQFQQVPDPQEREIFSQLLQGRYSLLSPLSIVSFGFSMIFIISGMFLFYLGLKQWPKPTWDIK